MTEATERVLRLAEQTRPCPKCREFALSVGLDPSGHSKACKYCYGTGHVALYPMLRQGCPEWGKHFYCGGRGWVPDMSLEALLEAALSLLAEDGYLVITKNGVALVGFPGKPQQENRVWVEGPPAEALSLALTKAAKEEA